MLVAFVVLGAINGILSGLLGIGGGIVSVPVLFAIFSYASFAPQYAMHLAIGTSLGAMVLTSISSTAAHQMQGSISWNLWRLAVPGIIIGSSIGTKLVDLLPVTTLKQIFATILFLVALRLFSTNPKKGSQPNPMITWFMIPLGGIIGLLAGLLGIGGSTISVPLFMTLGLDIRRATATAAACVLPGAIASSIFVIWFGMDEVGLPDYCLGYMYVPASLLIGAVSVLTAPIGASLVHKISRERLTKVFGCFLAIVAIRMVW